jgi:hypothetical protein
MHVDLTGLNLSEYTIEFWMLIDMLGVEKLNRAVNNYYFVAPPNLVYMVPTADGMFYKHTGAATEYSLNTINTSIHEWSIVYINVK